MKKAWPIAPAALLVGTVLYAAIASVRPADPAPDRWVERWEKAGLDAQLRGTEGARLLLSGEKRRIREPGFEGTTIREYWVQGVLVQVVEFPSADLLPEAEEGRHTNYRPRDTGRRAHVFRRGPLMVLVSPKMYAIGTGPKTTPSRTVRAILDVVEDAPSP